MGSDAARWSQFDAAWTDGAGRRRRTPWFAFATDHGWALHRVLVLRPGYIPQPHAHLMTVSAVNTGLQFLDGLGQDEAVALFRGLALRFPDPPADLGANPTLTPAWRAWIQRLRTSSARPTPFAVRPAPPGPVLEA